MVAGVSEWVCGCVGVVCRVRCLGVMLTIRMSEEDRCGQWLCISIFIADARVVHLVSGALDSPQQRRFTMDGGGLARLTRTFTCASRMMTTCHTTTLTAVRDQRHGRLVGLVDNEIGRFLEGFSSASPIQFLTNEAVALSLLALKLSGHCRRRCNMEQQTLRWQ